MRVWQIESLRVWLSYITHLDVYPAPGSTSLNSINGTVTLSNPMLTMVTTILTVKKPKE